MQHSQTDTLKEGHASIGDVVGIREQTAFQKMIASQAFWVAVALLVLVVFMTWLEPSFGTVDNITNITRNFAPIAIMGLGMTVVLITGGIDLSVGSVMGLVAIVAGLSADLASALVRRVRRGAARGPRLRRLQRFLRRLYRHAVLRGDARHAVDRALAGGRAFRQPDALPVRTRCADRQGDRPGEMAACTRRTAGCRIGSRNCPRISG